MQITINRSDEWCIEQAAITAENVLNTLTIEVSPESFYYELKKDILAIYGYGGLYPDAIDCIGFYRSGELSIGYKGYGRVIIKCDSHNPTSEEIAEALATAIYEARATQRSLERKKQLERELSNLEEKCESLRTQLSSLE